MKKHKKGILGLSLIAILSLSLVLATIVLDVDTIAETEEEAPDRTPITTYEVKEEEVSLVERTIGSIQPNQAVSITSGVSGEVTEVHTYVGDTVKRNAPVVTIKTVTGQEVILRSPIKGRISMMMPQRGELIGPSLVAQVVNDSWLIAVTQVTADQLKQIELLKTVRIYLDGDENRQLNGYVGHINDVAATRSGLYEVEVEIISATNNVAVGEFAYIDFIIEEEDYLVVPKQIVQMRDDVYAVFKVEGDRVIEQIVELGPEKDGRVAIISGLEAETLVASLGNQYLEDGSLIEIMN